MQQLFIINPTAGKADASTELVPRIRTAAARAGVEPRIEITQSKGHARQLAAQAAASGEEVHIYAAGGDGTMNEPARNTSVMTSQTIRKRVFSFFPMFLSPSFSCVLRQQSPAKRAAGI